MKKTASVAWLIIFLCAIVFGIYSLWGYGWHLRKTKDLQEETESLKAKIEQLEKQQKPTKEIFPSVAPLSTPSAKPLLSPLPKLKEEATISGKTE